MILRSFSYAAICAFFTLFLLSCSSGDKNDAPRPGGPGGAGANRPPVRADAWIVSASQVSDDLNVPGSLVAAETAEIHPEVSGLITRIYFTEGSNVSKGALLVKLKDDDLQAQLRKLRVQLQVARTNEQRSAQLLKIQGISRQDYEAQALQVSNINADIAVIQTQIEKTNIRAPFSGRLGLRMVSVGAYVTPQSIISTISQNSGMKLDFTIPERYSRQLSKGQIVRFSVDGTDQGYSARIIATEPGISQETRTLQVRAAVMANQSGLLPGGFATVKLAFDPDPNALTVPTQAIIPQARGKKVYVYNGGKAKFVEVTTGLRDSANVQVTSGLKIGDTVLVTGLLALKPEAKVNLGKVLNGTQGATTPNRTDSTTKTK
jgi:membrane fusion protein, multidrug efflux system